jgi:phosphatidate phosphatase APP1
MGARLCRVLLSRPIAADEPSKRRRKRAEQGIRGWRSFTSVPVGDVPVVIEVGGERIEVLADRGGVVDTRVPVSLAPGWHQATLRTEGSEPVEAPIWIVGPDVHFGIISDVDDTVMVTALPRRSSPSGTRSCSTSTRASPPPGWRCCTNGWCGPTPARP